MRILTIKRIVLWLSLIVIAISIFFASWFVIHGDIIFHTDIARDFLLMEDVVRNKPVTLIGPRSGGIPGVFHGPLWTYLNVPAFILGNGNPAVVGWFWFLLFLVNVYAVYWVAKRMFKEEVGWIAAATTATISAASVPSFFNPFGAVILAPVLLYFFYRYVIKNQPKDLLIGLFVLGLIIQFQMAFGVPILVLLLPLLLYKVFKNRKFKHLSALLILLIPLSTFILFDLKHHFLQTRSVVNYLTGRENAGKVAQPFLDILRTRIHSIVYDGGPGFVTHGNNWLWVIFIILLAISLYKVFNEKKYKDFKSFYLLLLYFYIGYWLLTVLYRGVVWGYYYWPFLSLVSLVFSAFYLFVDKRLFIIIFLLFSTFNLNWSFKNEFKNEKYFGSDGSSWRFYRQAAKEIFRDAPSDFGYYVFTADQYGYSGQYAMHYLQTKYPNKKSYPYEKRAVTYLLISKSNNPTISDDWWKKEKVKINKAPEKVFTFKNNGFWIEKYSLTPEEVADKSDETLIHTLIFR